VRSQRTRLLGAAIRVAGTEGYEAMTVTAVIAAAGVSRKTFYELFSEREECFLAAFDLVAERGLAGAREAYRAGREWPERLRGALDWTLHALALFPLEAQLAFVEVFAAGPRGLRRRDDALRAWTELLRPGYDAAPAGVAIPPLMHEAVVGALYELVFARVRQGRAAELPGLLPQLLYCALAPFVGPVAAASASGYAPPRRRRRTAKA
jgi:AcrR family transcriptional regulator